MNTTKTESDYRADADAARKAEQDSFDRSDTDGCVSQWCHSLNAREADKRADIIRDGGKAQFTGLYQGDRRVAAKLIETQYGMCWILRDSETALIAARGSKFIPDGERSRVQKKLGLSERSEMAPAWAKVSGSGKGFSGLTSCYIAVYRTGDEWGQDATPVA